MKRLALYISIVMILLVWLYLQRAQEGFACRRAGPWTATAAGWQPRMALIHNEHEPEQNQLAWSPETMPRAYAARSTG